MLKTQQVSEQQLVPRQGDTRDDQRQRKRHAEVKRQRFMCRDLLLVFSSDTFCGRVVTVSHARRIGIHALHVNDTHEPPGQSGVCHVDFDVFFERVFRSH